MKKILLLLLYMLPLLGHAQIISTFAGTGIAGNTGDGNSAILAKINYPIGGVFDKNGNYYFALGTVGNCIRKISSSGIISTVVGVIGSSGFSGDSGLATVAKLNNPQAVTVDAIGNLFIADAANNRIRKVDISTGIITTIAGDGSATYGGDGGPATAAKIYNPLDLCFDKLGNLFFTDPGNGRIRKINSSGIISTIAGTGTIGVGVDGIVATASQINTIEGIFTDDTGNLFIGDVGRLRKINNATGIITTIAGNTTAGSSGDGGPATAAQLEAKKITRDGFNNIYIAERSFNRVRKINSAGIITSIVGTGTAGYNGDNGLADTSQLNYPAGVSVDLCGNLYIADAHNWRVRKIAYPANPHISISGSSSSSIGSSVTIIASLVNAGINYSIKWYNKGILFNTTTTPSVTYTKAMCTDSITAMIYGCSDSALSAVHVVGCNVGVPSPVPAVGGMTCYPNPVSGELFITAGGEKISSVVVSNLLGEVVFRQTFNEEEQIKVNMAGFAKGLYFVKVNGVYVERVVKE